ncbi:MAG: hypothetical protein ACSHXD_20245 [Marinosulfonomonas sp.]
MGCGAASFDALKQAGYLGCYGLKPLPLGGRHGWNSAVVDLLGIQISDD